MSWENVAIVRAAYSAYENGGVEALFPYFGPDIEWDMTKTGVADRTYTGPDGVREFFERLGQAWQEYTFRYDTFLHAGDEVLAIGGFRGRVAGSATEVEAPLVHIWTLQEGKGVRLRAYLDYSAALEAAAGLGYRGTPASVEVVRRGFDALARGDPAEFLESFDPEVEVLEDHSIPDARSYRGHEGIADWWRALEHNWADLEVNPERFIHDRGDVAVLLRVSGRGRASGVPVEGEFGALLKVRNGLVVKLEIYAGWDAVLKAWELHQREADAAA